MKPLNIRALLKHALHHRGYVAALSSGYLMMAISTLMQIALVPFYLDAFGQYQFGILIILLAIKTFAGIGIGWLSGGALRILGEYAALSEEAAFRRASGLVIKIYVAYGFALAILIGMTVVCFGAVLFSGGNEADKQSAQLAFLLLGPYLVFDFAAGGDRLALIAQKRQGVANIAQLSGLLVCTAGIVLLLLSGGDMSGIMICYTIGSLVSIFLTRRLLKVQLGGLSMGLPTSQDADLFKRLGGRTGIGFFLQGALILALMSDTVWISWLGGAKAAAEFYLVWRIALGFVQLLWKVPEQLAPYLVQMDARGEHAALKRIAYLGYFVIGIASLFFSVFYAMFGSQLVTLWVGEEFAPENPLSYVFAGGAIFWLGLSRLPVVLASARLALRQLNLALGAELLGKLIITLLLFPKLGYVAVLVAINLAHGLGVSFLYFRLLRPGHTSLKHKGPRQIN